MYLILLGRFFFIVDLFFIFFCLLFSYIIIVVSLKFVRDCALVMEWEVDPLVYSLKSYSKYFLLLLYFSWKGQRWSEILVSKPRKWCQQRQYYTKINVFVKLHSQRKILFFKILCKTINPFSNKNPIFSFNSMFLFNKTGSCVHGLTAGRHPPPFSLQPAVYEAERALCLCPWKNKVNSVVGLKKYRVTFGSFKVFGGIFILCFK